MRSCGLDYRTRLRVVGRARAHAGRSTGCRRRQLTSDAARRRGGRGRLGEPLAARSWRPRRRARSRGHRGHAVGRRRRGAGSGGRDGRRDRRRRRALVAAAEAHLARFAAAETALREQVRCVAGARRLIGRGGLEVTDADRDVIPTLPDDVAVVNVGLPMFADAVAAQGRAVVTVDWRIPAGGEPELVAALARLYGRRSRPASTPPTPRSCAGSTRACPARRASRPPASVVPGFGGRTLLHCGPPIDYADACDPLRRSMRAAVVAEGWAATSTTPTGCSAAGRGRSRRRPTTTTPWSPWSRRWDRRSRCGWSSNAAGGNRPSPR